MEETELRRLVVEEALSWVGTPYRSNAMIKGRQGGGTDCVMLLIAVYSKFGLLPGYVDPRPYPPEWHIHRNEERYMNEVMRLSTEVPGPPQRQPLPADVVMFKIGRVFAHGAIVADWPRVIHAIGNDVVLLQDVSKNIIGKRALAIVPQRFFTLWPEV